MMNRADLSDRLMRVAPLLIGPAMELEESSIQSGLRMVSTWRWETDGWPAEEGDLSDALNALRAFLLHALDARTHASLPDYPIRRLRLVAARDALEAKVDILMRRARRREFRAGGDEERWRTY
jgi:hypothetical protein